MAMRHEGRPGPARLPRLRLRPVPESGAGRGGDRAARREGLPGPAPLRAQGGPVVPADRFHGMGRGCRRHRRPRSPGGNGPRGPVDGDFRGGVGHPAAGHSGAGGLLPGRGDRAASCRRATTPPTSVSSPWTTCRDPSPSPPTARCWPAWPVAKGPRDPAMSDRRRAARRRSCCPAAAAPWRTSCAKDRRRRPARGHRGGRLQPRRRARRDRGQGSRAAVRDLSPQGLRFRRCAQSGHQ